MMEINAGTRAGTTFTVKLKDADGTLISTGVGVRKEGLIEAQLPPIKNSGDFILQVFVKNEQVTEAIVHAEKPATNQDLLFGKNKS
jgi:hypothetical protein